MHLHNIDGVIVPFDNKWNNIALALSGGADSALLAYILCNLVKDQTIHVVSHTRMWKSRPWQSYDSLNVLNWLKDRFPNINFIRHTNFIAPDVEYGNMGPIIKDEYGKMVSGDNAQQRAFGEYVCFHNNVDAYYNAVTRNPKSKDLGGLPERDVEPNENNKHLSIMQHMGFWALHPFRFVEKSWVVKQYIENDLWDLFDRTRSCEGDNTNRPEVFLGMDYTNYKAGDLVPICGRCFWCKERAWAIEQNTK